MLRQVSLYFLLNVFDTEKTVSHFFERETVIIF